jgi:hypothetical protein
MARFLSDILAKNYRGVVAPEGKGIGKNRVQISNS